VKKVQETLNQNVPSRGPADGPQELTAGPPAASPRDPAAEEADRDLSKSPRKVTIRKVKEPRSGKGLADTVRTAVGGDGGEEVRVKAVKVRVRKPEAGAARRR
jgi:hypothetical protein